MLLHLPGPEDLFFKKFDSKGQNKVSDVSQSGKKARKALFQKTDWEAEDTGESGNTLSSLAGPIRGGPATKKQASGKLCSYALPEGGPTSTSLSLMSQV